MLRSRPSASLLALLLLLPNATAQQGTANHAHEADGLVRDGFPDLTAAFVSWQQQQGKNWRLLLDSETGYAEMLYGGSTEPAFSPLVEEDRVAVATEFIERAQELHGIEPEGLELAFVRFLPLGNAGTTDKWTVAFKQVAGGVEVDGARVNVLTDMRGRLLSIHSTAVPAMGEININADITPQAALQSGNNEFSLREGVVPTRWTSPELIVARDASSGARTARLAWRFDMIWKDADTEPVGWTYRIDAMNGAILSIDQAIHRFDVTGSVTSMATPGTAPDSGGNPETSQVVPYARVTSSAGTVFTDVNGDFIYPGVNSPLNVTVEYVGTWSTVNNVSGGEYSLTASAQPNQANNLLMNPSPSEQTTSQSNAYIGVNLLHDWVKGIAPSDPTVDFFAQSNVNLNDTCNAYYDGVSVNFFNSGAGCVNTAFSTVIAHEMGHWYNVLYGTGNGSDGIGEGNADVFAMYLYDDPVVGFDFCGSGCNIRSGLNVTQFCGDCCGGCYGGVHADGEVWMGAAWKIRVNLNASLGNSAGDLAADTIFITWMNSFNQTQIKSIMETQWLTLDDDDGNIGNGTPHYSEIDNGFLAQGFPGYGLDLVTISGVTLLPDTTDDVGPYQVDATVAAPTNPPLLNAALHYSVNGGSFQNVLMAPVAGDDYRGFIPGQASPAVVEYYVTGTDNNSNTGTFPSGGPAEALEFSIGTLTVFLFNDFEGGSNDGWFSGAPGDNATTGNWERVNPVGTAAQPEDDTTAAPGDTCWVTGQQPGGGSLGTNDVDGGTTTLLSPIFDASGLSAPKISYSRWYSNSTGAEPGTDTFLIDISNNGGSTWTSVEVLGPTGPGTIGGWIEHEFDVGMVITPSANMQLRFAASDLAGGSIIEAALDDIRGSDLSGSGITDCNNNGVDDATDISSGTSQDCNSNGIPDECEADCDNDGTPDGCEIDCNNNGTPDDCESFADCNNNGIPDDCEADCDNDGTPDDCEADCNGNGTPDDCESISDCNNNGIPDECEADCDNDGTPDDCEVDCNGNGTPDDCESFADCNNNGIPDECEPDCDNDGTPDDCEADCNSNGTPDDCESSADCNNNGIPDECEPDCDNDGTPDDCEVDCNGNGTPDDCESFADCNNNGIPDECEPDCDNDGTPDDCEADCNSNGTPDDCESFADCNNNGIPDECEPDCDNDGTPDDCEVDCNGNGTPDDCESFADCNNNGIPDECEPDCDNDGTPDDCEVDCNGNGTPDDCESIADCNNNGIPDECEPDCDNDGTPDDCEVDCNGNGTPDDCESFADCNNNGIPDECEPDCDNDGTPDDCEADCNSNGTPDDCESSADCNNNGIPDECEPDCDNDGTPDDCEVDCNGNGTPDDCESFADCNNNGIPDECEPDCDNDGTPDDCEADCNSNGTPDDCESFADCNNNGI
ncbi:MAG: hypothetical protein ACI835_005059, partial [Planctomycetota bacterium]